MRDDGLHLIDAEMVTLDLHDTLEVRSGDGLELVGPSGVTGGEVDAGPNNLVNRALRLVGRRALICLRKEIPAGAGLGGGSADAAAVLRWAGFSDLEAAACLGADIAFCLVGGRARVTGIGERVESLPFQPRIFTLATPPIHCSTSAVYRAWDEMGGPTGANGNDLEPAALAVAPDLLRRRDELGHATGQTPRLAGSGSTWFVEGCYPEAGRVARTTPAVGITCAGDASGGASSCASSYACACGAS